MRLIRNLYLTNRFFLAFTGLIAFTVTSFFWPFLFPVAQALLVLFAAAFIMEVVVLFWQKNMVRAARQVPELFSLNDPNPVKLSLKSHFVLPLHITVIDEQPVQFQNRDFRIELTLKPQARETIVYELTPKTRGEYNFGRINLFLHSTIGLVERRVKVPAETMVPVYPSVLQSVQNGLKYAR